MKQMFFLGAICAGAFAAISMTMMPLDARAADAACVKREMAKGNSQCIAKAKCDGVHSRKDQARRCG